MGLSHHNEAELLNSYSPSKNVLTEYSFELRREGILFTDERKTDSSPEPLYIPVSSSRTLVPCSDPLNSYSTFMNLLAEYSREFLSKGVLYTDERDGLYS